MVCSTLVLAAINDIDDLKIKVEGEWTPSRQRREISSASPLTPGAKPPDQDALVDALTRDGLYLYTARVSGCRPPKRCTKRRRTKRRQKTGTIGTFFTDAPDDFTIIRSANTFAFDYSGREFDDQDAKDSEKWRSPGEGHGR